MAAMEGVMVVDKLERSDKALRAGCRSCGVCKITVSTPYCVVATRGE